MVESKIGAILAYQVFKKGTTVKLSVYQHLLQINTAFEQVLRSLGALQAHRQFHAAELARFSRLSKETRASINSYLTSVIEVAETAAAGKQFSKRLTQEKDDEAGTWDR